MLYPFQGYWYIADSGHSGFINTQIDGRIFVGETVGIRDEFNLDPNVR
jgi:hypothetical protein